MIMSRQFPFEVFFFGVLKLKAKQHTKNKCTNNKQAPLKWLKS